MTEREMRVKKMIAVSLTTLAVVSKAEKKKKNGVECKRSAFFFRPG